MSILLDRARRYFAAMVAALAHTPAHETKGAYRPTWAPFNARYQRSKHRVAMDKRAAEKARNQARNK